MKNFYCCYYQEWVFDSRDTNQQKSNHDNPLQQPAFHQKDRQQYQLFDLYFYGWITISFSIGLNISQIRNRKRERERVCLGVNLCEYGMRTKERMKTAWSSLWFFHTWTIVFGSRGTPSSNNSSQQTIVLLIPLTIGRRRCSK